MKEESFYITWVDPVDDTMKYACLSGDTGIYWSETPDDPNVIDGSFLRVEYTIDDTIKQISEQIKLKKGVQFNRRFCIKHPEIHAWLKVEKKPTGRKDEDNKPIRAYVATWSHKFKGVSVVSSITGRPQGNPGLRDKEYAKRTVEKSKVARKRRLESVEIASKRLNFNPAENLIAWATGDQDKLRTKTPITNGQRLKALEILAGYTWAKPKPVDTSLTKQNTGPQIHVMLPADGSETKGSVLEHQNEDEFQHYLARQTESVYAEGSEEPDTEDLPYYFDLPEEDK